MRIWIILMCLGCVSTRVEAQLYDHSWVIGRAGVKADFDFDSLRIKPLLKYVGPISSIGSMCDYSGTLRIISDGWRVQDGNGDTVPNGLGLLDSNYASIGAYDMQQGVIVLPKGNDQFYIISHSVSDSLLKAIGGNYPYVDRLYCAVADMSANGGKGQVISKQVNICSDSRQGESRLTACLHANGRDWWLVSHGYCDNRIFTYLVTPDTITGPTIQSIGPTMCNVEWMGQAVFSPDGTKFTLGSRLDSVFGLMDFDRCTGVLSNPISLTLANERIYFPSDTKAYSFKYGPSGLAFSANGRYLYVSNRERVVQFDLQAPNLNKGQKSIFYWDYVHGTNYPELSDMYLTPSGMIWVNYFQGISHQATVILHPDLPDTSCGFRLYGFSIGDTLKHFPISCSNMPTTMRLGALKGSGCDTIPNGINDVPLSKIVVSPNPAHTSLSVSLRQYEKDAMLYIYDARGREMYSNKHFYLDDYVDVRSYPVGVYYLRFQSASGEYSGKFIKE